MTILQPVGTAQNINFIGRSNTFTSINLLRESTNTTEVLAFNPIGVIDNGYYTTVPVVSSTLIEGEYYVLNILNNTDIIFSDKVFVTAQTLSDYTINNSEYNEHTTTNEYTIYE